MNYQELIDIGILLSQLGIQTTEYRFRFSGCCPSFTHRDEHPSWSLYKNTGYHVCFSCGFQGSLNHLVKYFTGKTIWEYCQIGQPENYLFKKSLDKDSSKVNNKLKQEKKVSLSSGKLYSIYSNREVINYLLKRKIHPDFIKYFKIKYCIEAKFNHTTYKNRILIPIEENSELLSVEGRDFTEIQKEKVLYPDGATVNTLFNYDNLDKNKPLIIIEGIMDLHKIWQYITKNVTCTFGSMLTFRQIELLQQFDCIFIPDNDKAGYNMLKRFDEYSDREFEVAELPIRCYKIINRNKIVVPEDPGQAYIRELKYALSYRKRAVRYFMEKTGIVDNKKVTW